MTHTSQQLPPNVARAVAERLDALRVLDREALAPHLADVATAREAVAACQQRSEQLEGKLADVLRDRNRAMLQAQRLRGANHAARESELLAGLDAEPASAAPAPKGNGKRGRKHPKGRGSASTTADSGDTLEGVERRVAQLSEDLRILQEAREPEAERLQAAESELEAAQEALHEAVVAQLQAELGRRLQATVSPLRSLIGALDLLGNEARAVNAPWRVERGRSGEALLELEIPPGILGESEDMVEDVRAYLGGAELDQVHVNAEARAADELDARDRARARAREQARLEDEHAAEQRRTLLRRCETEEEALAKLEGLRRSPEREDVEVWLELELKDEARPKLIEVLRKMRSNLAGAGAAAHRTATVMFRNVDRLRDEEQRNHARASRAHRGVVLPEHEDDPSPPNAA